MWCVYLLKSEVAEGGRYVGMMSDLKRRLAEHNSGKSSHASKFLPWRIVTHMA
ncbi:GIY-YIG nuclease family protein, partial [Mesorhizobium sp. M7A.F.Ca.CA.004.02.1.1]